MFLLDPYARLVSTKLTLQGALGREADQDDLLLVDRHSQMEVFPSPTDDGGPTRVLAEVVGDTAPGSPEYVAALERRLSEVETELRALDAAR